MGILDEAIREHLELKRAHGADDSELKQLEDQAFGPPERPGDEGPEADLGELPPADADAEAPTAFMSQPDLGEERAADGPPEAPETPARREPAAGVADIQEAPPAPPAEPDEEEPADVDASADEGPAAVEEQPAAEHEAVPAPVEHTTEEREVISDQPTQMYDVEEEFSSVEAPAPADEDLVAEEATEARLGPAEPAAPVAPVEDEEDEEDDFFDEQRLSDELDQALEGPVEPAPEEPESISEEHELPAERTEEHELPRTGAQAPEEDVLEETPDFLEEAPEDDQLWFEQKPPKDFDFDD